MFSIQHFIVYKHFKYNFYKKNDSVAYFFPLLKIQMARCLNSITVYVWYTPFDSFYFLYD
jgi:hypothetical protein